MSKPRFYTEPGLIKNDLIELPPEETYHALKVLRLGIDSLVDVLDGSGNIYNAKVIDLHPLKLSVVKMQRYEPVKKLNVYAGLGKSKKTDVVVRQLTEIGCYKIVIFTSIRSIPKLTSEKKSKKLLRWQKIAIEAAKQAKREYIPEILFLGWADFINEIELPIIALYEKGGKYLSDCLGNEDNSLSLIIGSEGGFTKGEIEELKGKGAQICWLGRYILRLETASIYAASVAASKMGISVE